MLHHTFLIIVTIFVVGCSKKESNNESWKIISHEGNISRVIATTEPNAEVLSKEIKNLIIEETRLGNQDKSRKISLIRKPRPGVTETVGPYWISKREDNMLLLEFEGYEDSEQEISRSIATGHNTTSKTMTTIMITHIEQLLKNSNKYKMHDAFE